MGLVLVLLVARQYADPVRQLAQVADRVAQLDFSGRYAGKAQDEIGDLGRSINTMSAALEQTITQLKNANARLTADIRQKEEQDRGTAGIHCQCFARTEDPAGADQHLCGGAAGGYCRRRRKPCLLLRRD